MTPSGSSMASLLVGTLRVALACPAWKVTVSGMAPEM